MASRPRAVDHRDLAPGGAKFWKQTTESNPDLTDGQLLLLLECCRVKDKLDQIEASSGTTRAILDTVELPDGETVVVVLDQPQQRYAAFSALFAKHLAQLRLPNANGTVNKIGRPAGAVGAYKTASSAAEVRAQMHAVK